MLLRHLKKRTKTIGFRLTAWYSAVFIVSFFLLFFIAYVFLSSSLRHRDQETLQLKLGELATLYKSGGVQSIEREVAIEKEYGKRTLFFVRIAGPHNETLFLSVLYRRAGFDDKQLRSLVRQENGTTILVPAKNGEDLMQVASTRLSGDLWLQVGKSTEDQKRILEHFRETFIQVTIVLLLIGCFGGVFLAFRARRPIRDLIQTVSAIDISKMDARVPDPETGDELDDLVRLFNGMLAKISTLAGAMRGSLDNVAHDLRTPMTRFRAIAEMALKREQNLEICHDALSDCIEESERILKMLDSLMDISEAETGFMRLDRRQVKVSDLMDVVEMYRYVAEEKNVQLRVTVPQKLEINADPTRMRQVLGNLLDNSIKYTPSGGQIEIEAREQGDHVAIVITDNGIGISQEELPRIWDRLYRGDQSRSEKGLGLGLSLVKAIVQAHKGRVEVLSEPGKGSTFIVYLPSRNTPSS
jgi:heavy metal sensor kinase